jgi:hypothetical protein
VGEVHYRLAEIGRERCPIAQILEAGDDFDERLVGEVFR